jgi:hypothetical protein
VGSRRRLLEATDKVLALKKQKPDLVVLPAHDPTARPKPWRSLPGKGGRDPPRLRCHLGSHGTSPPKGRSRDCAALST